MFQLIPKKCIRKKGKKREIKKKNGTNITELIFKWNVGESETVILNKCFKNTEIIKLQNITIYIHININIYMYIIYISKYRSV